MSKRIRTYEPKCRRNICRIREVIDRIVARNNNLTAKQIGNTEKHNERKKESYVNPDIVSERSYLNYHYKSPADDYESVFASMVESGEISTRGLKPDAKKYGEMIIDVNSAYFHNHGGYEYAKQFYASAYRAAAKIIGGEKYILSAVMHADERNSKMSKELGKDIYHYHLHIVYIPVVEKEIRYSKRCKDPSLVGKVKEVIHQVSASKKWASSPAIDENGNVILNKNGKPVLKKSYSKLQDDIIAEMRSMGYTDIERGEKNSGEEHLSVTQFKIMQEEETLSALEEKDKALTAKIDEDKKKTEVIAKKSAKIKGMINEEFPDADELLPYPKTIETAGAYRKRIMPIVARIIDTARTLFSHNFQLQSKLKRANDDIDRKQSRINNLEDRLKSKDEEMKPYKDRAGKYNLLIQGFGQENVTALLEKARENLRIETERRRAERQHRNYYER